MPKDAFGRQTNVKKAEKAAYKIKNAAERPGRGQKKLAKASVRSLGFSRRLDDLSSKKNAESGRGLPPRTALEVINHKPKTDYTVKEAAAARTADKTKSSFKYDRADQATNAKSRVMVSGLKAGTVKRATNAGARKAEKGVKKVYKKELKLAKAEKAVQ